MNNADEERKRDEFLTHLLQEVDEQKGTNVEVGLGLKKFLLDRISTKVWWDEVGKELSHSPCRYIFDALLERAGELQGVTE